MRSLLMGLVVGIAALSSATAAELKAKGIDSFLYVSPEGEEIQPVK